MIMNKTKTPIKRLTKKATDTLDKIREKFIANETRKGNAYMDYVCIPNDGRILELALDNLLMQIIKLENGDRK